VYEIEDGARVDKGGLVRRSNGTSYQITPCLYPVYSTILGTKPPSPVDTGWIEYAFTRKPADSSYHQLNANWTVPTAPLAPYSYEVYFTFPGLESNTFIIQPVVQYGSSAAGGGTFWGAASWHCDTGSNCMHSPLILTGAGDAIYGSVAASNCLNGSCVWTITSQDVTTGQRTTLTVTDAENYFVAVGSAVEVRGGGGGGPGITSCDQYPINGVFNSGISLYDQNGALLSPSWSGQVQPGTSPSCSFNVTSTTTSVNLYHNPCGPNCVTASGGLTAQRGGTCDPLQTSGFTIVEATASGTSAINVKDSCGHTGTMTLTGATASGGLTAHHGAGCDIFQTAGFTITAVTASGTNAINLTDSCGNTGTITLTGAAASGGLTADGGGSCGLQTSGFAIIADTAWSANGFDLADNCGHNGYVKLS